MGVGAGRSMTGIRRSGFSTIVEKSDGGSGNSRRKLLIGLYGLSMPGNCHLSNVVLLL